jgi:hypothetical protein
MDADMGSMTQQKATHSLNKHNVNYGVCINYSLSCSHKTHTSSVTQSKCTCLRHRRNKELGSPTIKNLSFTAQKSPKLKLSYGYNGSRNFFPLNVSLPPVSQILGVLAWCATISPVSLSIMRRKPFPARPLEIATPKTKSNSITPRPSPLYSAQAPRQYHIYQLLMNRPKVHRTPRNDGNSRDAS